GIFFIISLLNLVSCQLDLPPLGNDRFNDNYNRNQQDYSRNRQDYDRNQQDFNRNQQDYDRNQQDYDRNQQDYDRNQQDLNRNPQDFDRNRQDYNRNQGDFSRRPIEPDYRQILAKLDFQGTERCSANVAAQWAYETNVNEYTQLQAVS
ncbi:uncharacterized protein DDB_G0290685-like, partial [Fopius arisanus]|uniref:Uncharacterized protein DDB_G0290685-like n=1 Tax=Fopius arisanus TaxID=64838 RepID=A0A9R1TPM4_9HYME